MTSSIWWLIKLYKWDVYIKTDDLYSKEKNHNLEHKYTQIMSQPEGVAE